MRTRRKRKEELEVVEMVLGLAIREVEYRVLLKVQGKQFRNLTL
jgi:hypothetical protein